MDRVLDWCFGEDRCRVRTGHGPENITRLRRFVVGVINKFKGCLRDYEKVDDECANGV